MKEIEVVTPTASADTRAVSPFDAQESRIERYGRFWAVYDATGRLVCVTVYKKGALEIVRRLRAKPQARFEARSG